MNFTYIEGTSFKKLRVFSHTLSFILNTIFSSLRETLCAGRVKLFAEASERFTQRCVAAHCRRQNCILGLHSSGGHKDGGPKVLNRDCTEVEPLINFPLWLNPSNCLF